MSSGLRRPPRSPQPPRPFKSFIVWTILFRSFFAAFAQQDADIATSIKDAIPQGAGMATSIVDAIPQDEIMDTLKTTMDDTLKTTRDALKTTMDDTLKTSMDTLKTIDNAFQTCKTKQIGVFPNFVTDFTPGCQSVFGAAFHVMRKLINLIPIKDDAVKDIVENIMEPVHMIIEKVAEAMSAPNLCLGNFPAKTILDQEDGMLVS